MSQRPSPAEVYEDFVVRYQLGPFAEDLVPRAAPQPGERILDLACGTGIIARLAAPQVTPNGSVTGFDVSPGMLAVARRLADAAEVTVTWDEGDAASLPYDDSAFDLAICQQGLQFFPDKRGALSELHRVLAPGGRVVISTWAPIEHSPVFAAFNRVAEPHLGLAPLGPSFSLTDADTVRGLVEGAGFDEVMITPVEMQIRVPEINEFMRLYVRAVAAVVPALAERSPEELEAISGKIAEELGPDVAPYQDDDGIMSPMRTYVTIACQ